MRACRYELGNDIFFLCCHTALALTAPMLTTMTVESMPSKEQTARQAQEQESEGAGGLLGGFARRLGRKKSDDQSTGGAAKPNAVMTATNEVLKISTSVSPEETSIPAGFKLKD